MSTVEKILLRGRFRGETYAGFHLVGLRSGRRGKQIVNSGVVSSPYHDINVTKQWRLPVRDAGSLPTSELIHEILNGDIYSHLHRDGNNFSSPPQSPGRLRT